MMVSDPDEVHTTAHSPASIRYLVFAPPAGSTGSSSNTLTNEIKVSSGVPSSSRLPNKDDMMWDRISSDAVWRKGGAAMLMRWLHELEHKGHHNAPKGSGHLRRFICHSRQHRGKRRRYCLSSVEGKRFLSQVDRFHSVNCSF